MKINRQKALDAFNNYVAHYDVQNEMIRLKMEHTYRVADLCEQIARSIPLPVEDADLAWFTGLLHDVGRFEQLRSYGTFNDAESIDHALYGAQILFDEGKIHDYIEDATEDELAFIRRVISCHSAYRVPGDYTAREHQFADILRDADKIDILRVNVDFALEDIYNVTTEELESAEVTPAVMDSFAEHHAILRSLKRTPVDNIVGHISLVFELVYPYSRQTVQEQGYLTRLLNFQSKNPTTVKQFAVLRDTMKSICF